MAEANVKNYGNNKTLKNINRSVIDFVDNHKWINFDKYFTDKNYINTSSGNICIKKVDIKEKYRNKGIMSYEILKMIFCEDAKNILIHLSQADLFWLKFVEYGGQQITNFYLKR